LGSDHGDSILWNCGLEITLSEVSQDVNHLKYFVLRNTTKNKYREKCLLSKTKEQKKRIYKWLFCIELYFNWLTQTNLLGMLS